MAPAITDEQLTQFERDGLVTINGPCSTDELTTLNAVLDAKFPDPGDVFVAETTGQFFEPEIVAMVVHLFWEDLARAVLRADAVELASVGFRRTVPKPDARFSLEDEHLDFMSTTEQIDRSPRRMLCGCMMWLTEVGQSSFPLHYRPGSHRQVLEYVDCHRSAIAYTTHQVPPKLAYAAPVPVTATAGQVSVLHGTLVHSGSVTPGQSERRAFFVEYKAQGLDFPYYTDDNVEGRRAYLNVLWEHAPVDRRCVLPPPKTGST